MPAYTYNVSDPTCKERIEDDARKSAHYYIRALSQAARGYFVLHTQTILPFPVHVQEIAQKGKRQCNAEEVRKDVKGYGAFYTNDVGVYVTWYTQAYKEEYNFQWEVERRATLKSFIGDAIGAILLDVLIAELEAKQTPVLDLLKEKSEISEPIHELVDYLKQLKAMGVYGEEDGGIA